jgi:hypothetical protein
VIFDRFVRGDRARAYTEGSGLGLAIAQENATMHGGWITVHNAEGAGAAFTLTLPRTIPAPGRDDNRPQARTAPVVEDGTGVDQLSSQRPIQRTSSSSATGFVT